MKPAEYENELVNDIAQFYADPLGFVLYAFPWGEPGGPLEDFSGPDKWQAEQLQRIGSTIKADPDATIQEAISSGHGIGKSAETSWVILWAMSTRPGLAGVVTANTKNQLETKTWRELATWHKRAINEHWFEWSATKFAHRDFPQTWYVSAIPQSEHNSEAFAGLHAEHVLIIYDEASAIPDIIWEVTEGAMTTPRSMWFCYGNPTRNTGRFRECFGKYKHRWATSQIDSRTCTMTNKVKLAEWEADHGADSDFFRVRVRGEFPRSATNQLISSEAVQEARSRSIGMDEHTFQPVIIGIDVARFGADETVITIRQGRKLLEQQFYRGLDNIQVGAKAAEIYRSIPSVGGLMVDEVGVGSGVVDYLKHLGYPCIGVNAGAKPDNPKLYFNKRAEMWGRMKEWVEAGADIPDDAELAEQMTALEYDYTPKEQIRLEKKESLKARGLSSPDRADSLSITFAEMVSPFQPQDSFEPEWE